MNQENITTKSNEGNAFFKVYKGQSVNSAYNALSLEARYVYGILLDRKNFSRVNSWIDKDEKIFIYYTLESLSAELNCCINKVRKILNELKASGLILSVKQGLGKPNKIYVAELNEEENKNEGAVYDKENIIKCNSGLSKNDSLDYQNMQPNKTNINNTELNKTEYNNTLCVAFENPYEFSLESDKPDSFFDEEAKRVMDYLNERAAKAFRINSKNTLFIKERLREGYSLEDFYHVIDVKSSEWLNTEKEKYIRPSTLFKEANFDNYVNQRASPRVNAEGKARLENEHDYDVELLERALFGEE